MKRWKGAALLLLCTVVMLRLLQGLAQPEKENAHVPVLGIVTTAAEDDRREAQSEALVHAAEEHGFKVLEMPVERTQEAQIEAVRALIVYQVDAIAFTPLVESGWDNVLREAKSASVPLLSIDRAIAAWMMCRCSILDLIMRRSPSRRRMRFCSSACRGTVYWSFTAR